MPALDSQIALVTGAARGVGEAVALRLASLGAHVLLIARDTERLNQVRDQIQSNKGQATVLPCDLTDPDAIARLAEQVARDPSASTSSSTMRPSEAPASLSTRSVLRTGTASSTPTSARPTCSSAPSRP